jgi:hypothetical protein
MKFHTLKGRKVRLGILSTLDFSREGLVEHTPWVWAQDRIDGRLMTAHALFPAPKDWTIEQVVAQLETFEPEGFCFVGDLGGFAVGFSISSTDGDILIFSNVEKKS